ncbi:FERM domain-containing protein 4A-like isoform X3 [Physella acuta]|uniref:FERM domain-containing protein 4A-like isoform X3 n=1 Tax=Physella acuta TaxID=109671 RepID=UPI0027DC58F9|nr:FERM domain-containing protein 4A-like isoform X3 [Physella acuta]
MSMKEKRNVTFEEPEGRLDTAEPNNNDTGNRTASKNNKDDSRSRSRARSRSWSRFRTRRAKSQDAKGSRDTSCGSAGSSSGIKRERSLVNLVRTGSRNSVRSLVKLFETRSMNEGRKTQIVLLDERRLDIIIQPKLYSNDLLDLVASHFKLKEKHYFGLGFYDETNHFNWLQGEKRVLEHDFPKKTGLLVLHFSIRFYVDTIGLLRDTQTVELFYLNTRQALFRGQIECDTETVFELAAHVLQATNGDFVSEEETREELKKLPVIPTSSLKEHPSIAYCEDRVISYYEKLNGTTRGHAIVNYMTIVEKLPTYGIHYYDVKDKKDIPWWLGISPKGIAVYDKNDKTTPRKLFTWKTLENLYYRDKKFSIEVHGPKREDSGSQVSVSRRTFGASNVDVHAWFASTPQLTKCIWSMAVAQHQFYLDRKQSKGQLPAARSMSEIAEELCRSTTSLPGSLGSDISRSPSSHSLPSLCNSRYDLTIEQSDSLKAERDMYQALKARKEALEDALRKKTEELKILCLQEGDLTGEVPKDMPLAHGEPVPVFRKRVGTAFSLSHAKDINNLSSDLSKLELEVELQGKITAAAEKLASDKTVSKYVRKQRKQCYTKALGKLKEMEKKLREMRKQVGKTSSSQHQTGMAHDDRGVGITIVPNKQTTQAPRPAEPATEENHRTALSPSHSSPQLSAGYTPNGGAQGRGVQRGQHYPTVLGSRNNSDHLDTDTTLPLAANMRLDGSHDSGFSSANNMYNVTSQRTSHYESTDQLRSPATSEPGTIYPLHKSHDPDPQYGPSKNGPGDEPFLRAAANPSAPNLHYGSLDRKRRDYRQQFHRDVSPVRFKSRHHQNIAEYSGARAGNYRDLTSPANIMVEVPVHHERGQSMPAAKPAWGEASAQLHSPEHDRLKPAAGSLATTADHVYMPRAYMGSRPYQDIDESHVHTKNPEHNLSGVHHTSSQPVFHRTERSLSPLRSQPPPYHHHQRPLPPSGFDRPSQHPYHHYQPQVTSPTQTQPGFSDTARTIPIQRIESPTSTSPVPQYSQSYQPASPVSSGPSSPRSPATHASSALVTVTRLQPHTEVTKPYEISDFYRYSEKLRRQRLIDQYHRQLIGADPTSRSSSPLSVESDGHSSHSGSASQHSASSSHTHQSPAHHPFSTSNLKQPTRGPQQPYNRSVSAPLSSIQPSYFSQQVTSPTSHHAQPVSPSSHPGLSYPDGQITSSSSSYSVKSHGPNLQYAMQSSTSYKIQQVHSSAKHTMYQPPQPMTCKPVRNPSSYIPENQKR